MTAARSAWRPPVEHRRWHPSALDVEVLRLLSEGHTIDSVARRVGCSERTVRRHLRTIADDIGVESSIEVVVHAVRVGLI